ncbi:recombinase family protein [Rhodococcus sp. T7]|uniref:recombinase family protein n=1 Tax=Rhodococcus sp. T7 TaxID=627444 RepID=UPI001F193D6C|nr:recombinase family protein [Rhodococcus sp. T7]
MAAEDIHVDQAGGAKASRPQLDRVLQELREGDVLVVTRLERLGRSMLHLVTLGADLRERGIGLKVLEQGIDTATAEGQAMFGLFSILADYQRELAVANTRDGLAAARARGRKGGRPSKLSADQIELAQRLYDAGERTVSQIAGMLNVPRTTVYGHLNKRRVDTAPVTQEIATPPARTSRTCPTCGYEPTTRAEAAHQRADLAVTWRHRIPSPRSCDQPTPLPPLRTRKTGLRHRLQNLRRRPHPRRRTRRESRGRRPDHGGSTMAHHSRMDHHPRPSLPGPHLTDGSAAIGCRPAPFPGTSRRPTSNEYGAAQVRNCLGRR